MTRIIKMADMTVTPNSNAVPVQSSGSSTRIFDSSGLPPKSPNKRKRNEQNPQNPQNPQDLVSRAASIRIRRAYNPSSLSLAEIANKLNRSNQLAASSALPKVSSKIDSPEAQPVTAPSTKSNTHEFSSNLENFFRAITDDDLEEVKTHYSDPKNVNETRKNFVDEFESRSITQEGLAQKILAELILMNSKILEIPEISHAKDHAILKLEEKKIEIKEFHKKHPDLESNPRFKVLEKFLKDEISKLDQAVSDSRAKYASVEEEKNTFPERLPTHLLQFVPIPKSEMDSIVNAAIQSVLPQVFKKPNSEKV